MKINRIRAKNLKVASIEHELGPVTLFQGPNMIGKTARLQAVTLALAGHLPEAGKTNRATFGLSRSDEMEVEALFEDGSKVLRTWKQGKKGAVSAKTEGTELELPPVLLNPHEFLGLSSKARVDYIAANIPANGEGMDGEAVCKELAKVELKKGTREQFKILEQNLAKIEDSDHVRHEEEKAVTEWIDELIVQFNDEIRGARANVERLSKAQEAAVQMASPETTRSVDHELKEAQDKLAQLSQELYAAKTVLAQWESRERKIKEFEDLPNTAADKAKIELLEKDIATLREKASRKPRTREIMQERDEAEQEMQETIATIREAEKASSMFEAESQRLEETDCGCCGKHGVECDSQRKRHQVMMKELADKKDTIEAFIKIRAEQKKKVDAIAAKLNEEHTLGAEAYTAGQNATALENQKKNLENRIASVAESAAQLKALIAEHGEKPPVPTELEGRVNDAKVKILELQEMAKRHAARQSEEARKLEASELMKHNEDVQTVLKVLVKELETIRGKAVAASMKPLLERVSRMIEPVLGFGLVYEDGEIGKKNGFKFIPHDYFSGSEKLLTYAAISAALTEKAPVRIVMMDDISVLNAANRTALLKLMVDLASAGFIDQFIGTSCSNDTFEIEGLEVINLA